MSSTFRVVPLIPGLVNEVVLEIFLHFVAIDRDGPSTLVLVCTAWRDAVHGSKFLQSLRRNRRRPNPALGENQDKVEGGICIVSFDGGGPGSMSQLRMLEEFMGRLAFKEKAEADELLPADYFDLMGGAGFGGLVALLLGHLRMTTSQAMEEIARIGTATFPESKNIVSPDVNIVRLRKALESMLERNGHSIGMKLRDTSDSRCKVVLFAAATEVMDHCHPFRTYRSPRKSLECTFVDAACATMANPEYFSSVSIGPRLRKQNFAGIPHNFHNPMREVLKEAKLVFGEKTSVSLLLSLGAGQPARHSGVDDQVTRRSLIHCDGVARDLQDQLHGFAEYLRLNVDKGMEHIELNNWRKLGSIETYTNVYLEMNQITRYIDRAVQLLLQRNGSVTLGNLSGTSADCVVKFHSESLEKYLAMEFKQMQDVIQELGIEKVTLVDAIGNDIPIPKHFCPTYAMLLDVIGVYFRHQRPPGSDLVERGDYRLLHGSGRSIIDPVEWDQLEKVRLKVEMSMILHTRNNDETRCPRCRTRSEAPPTNGWATCASCSGQFQIEDQLLEYEVQSGDDSHNEEIHVEENSIVTPAVREPAQTNQGRSPIKINKKTTKEEELKFRLISVVNLLDTLSLASTNLLSTHPLTRNSASPSELNLLETFSLDGDLENKVSILEEKMDSQAAENENLRELLTRLQQENLQLKQKQFNFTFQQPLANSSTNTGVGGYQANSSNDATMTGVRPTSNTPSSSKNQSLWTQSPLNDAPLTRMMTSSGNSGNFTTTNANRANASTPQLTSNSASPSELNLLETFSLDGDLENKVSILEEKMDSQAAENENLRELLTRLQQENLQLKQNQFNTTFQQPLASISTNTEAGGYQARSSNDANMTGVWPNPTTTNMESMPQQVAQMVIQSNTLAAAIARQRLAKLRVPPDAQQAAALLQQPNRFATEQQKPTLAQAAARDAIMASNSAVPNVATPQAPPNATANPNPILMTEQDFMNSLKNGKAPFALSLPPIAQRPSTASSLSPPKGSLHIPPSGTSQRTARNLQMNDVQHPAANAPTVSRTPRQPPATPQVSHQPGDMELDHFLGFNGGMLGDRDYTLPPLQNIAWPGGNDLEDAQYLPNRFENTIGGMTDEDNRDYRWVPPPPFPPMKRGYEDDLKYSLPPNGPLFPRPSLSGPPGYGLYPPLASLTSSRFDLRQDMHPPGSVHSVPGLPTSELASYSSFPFHRSSQPQVPIASAPPPSPKKTSIGGESRDREPYNDEEIRLIEELIREAVQTNPDIKMAQLGQLIHARDPTRPATAWSRQLSKRKQAIDKARELARSGKSVANFPIDANNRKGRAYAETDTDGESVSLPARGRAEKDDDEDYDDRPTKRRRGL